VIIIKTMDEPEDLSTAKQVGKTDETQGYSPLDLRSSSNKRRRNEDFQNNSENRKVSDFFSLHAIIDFLSLC